MSTQVMPSAQGMPTELEAVHPIAMGEFTLFAADFEATVDSLAAGTLGQLGQALLDRPAADAAFSEDDLSQFLHASIAAELQSFRRGVLPECCPEVDALCVQRVARVGELKFLLSTYRVSQIALWRGWFESIERSEAGTELRKELLRYGSEFFLFYSALLADYVTDLYQRELEQTAQDSGRRRFHAVKGLLNQDRSAPPLDDFDLERHHVGVLAWGDTAAAAVRQLAARLERPVLLTGPLDCARWAWISGSRPFEPSDERLLAGFVPPPGSTLAFGEQAYGERGFRATHRQAQRARWASRSSEQQLVLYSDVAVAILASENPAEARGFVARELRGISDDSSESRRIRETLTAYFASDHNAASAAARLGVHQQTIANRLRAVEERLGRPVGARRLELELALRLRGCLRDGGS
jgi:hypothetical protein